MAKRVLALLLLALVAYGVVILLSIQQIRTDAHEALECFHTYEACMEQGDFTAAVDALDAVAENVGQIDAEANSWKWELAMATPILGEDVRAARSASSVANSLANEAILPVVDQGGEAFAAFSNVDFTNLEALGELIEQEGSRLATLKQTVKDSHEAAKTCVEDVNAIPQTHFKELNELVDDLKETSEETEEYLGQIDGILSFFAV